MIFISYNHQDQYLVDMIARRLEIEFGRDNIFYDRWSIQPGQSIIGQMDQGLENYTTFFFMLSPNSLKSKMVTKEWQSGLMRHLRTDNLKFIPVRLDDCTPPAILADQLYIDLYGDGLDSAVAKMKSVINNENTYNPHEDVSNIEYVKEYFSESTVKITVSVAMYSEHNLNIGFAFPKNSSGEYSFTETSEMMSGSNRAKTTFNGKQVEVFIISLMRPLTKNTPFYVTITPKSNQPINDIIVGQIKGNKFQFLTEKM